MHQVIKRRTGLAQIDLKELWAYRDLLGFLSWRDVIVRYKQTSIGVLWAFLRPLLTTLIFAVVFGRIARLPSENVPYPIFIFVGLLPWQFFANAFTDSANSIVGNGHVITKIYFPRLILPISTMSVAAADFAVSLIFLGGILVWYRTGVSPHIIFLPLFVLLCFVFTLGISLWVASLYVKYRDLRHLIPFIVQMGMYVSPVGYSSSIVPARWRLLYSLNPMVAITDGFRWSILGTIPLNIPGMIAGSALSTLLLLTGLVYFKNTERVFADIM